MSLRVELAVDRRLASQLGLITASQARECGLGQSTVRSRVRQGRWQAVTRGVYRVAGSPDTWDQRALAVCLRLGPGTALSHGTAGAIHQLPGMRRDTVEVVVCPGRRPTAPEHVVVHRPNQLTRVDLCVRDALRVTTPARTVIDLAAQLSGPGLRRVVDNVLCRKLVSRDRLLGRVDALSRRGRPGSARLREVLKAWESGRRAEGDEEMQLFRLLEDHRIPAPVRQHTVTCEGRVIARTDLAWPERRLALELDSEAWHDTPSAFHEDKARSLRLAAAGWEVLAVTPRNLREGSEADLLEAIRHRLGLPASARLQS